MPPMKRRTYKIASLALCVCVAAFTAAVTFAQTSTQDTQLLSKWQAKIIGDLSALKKAIAKFNANEAAGVSVAEDLAAIAAAEEKLKIDKKSLAEVAKRFHTSDQIASQRRDQ